MFHDTLQQGQVYIVRLRGRYIKARFKMEARSPQYGSGRNVSRYLFTNLETGHDITLKSKVKIKRIFTEKLDGVRPSSKTAFEIASGLNNQTHGDEK